MNLLCDIEKIESDLQEVITKISNLNFYPEFAIIAGSGISESLIDLEIRFKISYAELFGIKNSKIEGHKKQLIFGIFEGKNVLIFDGRFHLYEGIDIELIFAKIIICKLLNIKKLIITNAVGGLNPSYSPGDIMIVDSTINLMFKNILFKESKLNFERKENIWKKSTMKELINLNQQFHLGTYIAVLGPNYETPAEIKAYRVLGGDAIGMSVIPELSLASYLQFEILTCSLITNSLKETNTSELNHLEVLEIAEKSKKSMYNFFKSALNNY